MIMIKRPFYKGSSGIGGGEGGKTKAFNIRNEVKSPAQITDDIKISGSEKQVKWAKDIETNVFTQLEKSEYSERLEFNRRLENSGRSREYAKERGKLKEYDQAMDAAKQRAIKLDTENSAGAQLARESYKELFSSSGKASSIINSRDALTDSRFQAQILSDMSKAASVAKSKGIKISTKDGANQIKLRLSKWGSKWED